MANQINVDIAGIGRIYRGDEFLGEVFYALKVVDGEVPGIERISGKILALQPTLRLKKDRNKTLRLEDGRMYDITILFSDDMAGKYKILGDKSRLFG